MYTIATTSEDTLAEASCFLLLGHLLLLILSKRPAHISGLVLVILGDSSNTTRCELLTSLIVRPEQYTTRLERYHYRLICDHHMIVVALRHDKAFHNMWRQL